MVINTLQYDARYTQRQVVCLLAGYKLYDNEIRKEIREELDIYDLNKITVGYKSKWTQHLFIIKYKGINDFVYEYIPTGSKTYVHRWKGGQNNTHEDGTSLKWIDTLLLLLLMITF